MAAQGELSRYHPDWHQLLFEIQQWGQEAYQQLVKVMMEPTPAIIIRGCVEQFADAEHEVYPVLADLKNSLSNNINAKITLKWKVNTAVEVALLMAKSVVVLHGVDPSAAYYNMDAIVHPCISASQLQDKDHGVPVKVFGTFSGLGFDHGQVGGAISGKPSGIC